jgi:outer membrane lipoprotein-sorting protein
MPPSPSRPALAALGLAALLLTAGCLSGASATGAATDTVEPTETPADSETPADKQTPTDTATETSTATPTPTPTGPETAAELDAAFESRMTSLETFTGVRTQTVEYGNETTTSTTEMWARLTTGEYRSEVRSPADRAGNVVVGGTDTVWSYREEPNTVTKFDRTDTANNVSALVATNLATGFEITDYEEATLDGRETYRVTLVPETDESVNVTATAHLDRETYFPVSVEQSYELENRTVTTHIDYEEVTLNATIPDDRFTFDPPANATVETADIPETESFESLDAMREGVDAPVPDPSVPDDYEFTQGQVFYGDNTSLSLRYENDTTRLAVSKLESDHLVSDGENVTVGDRDGRLQTFGETKIVVWQCDGWRYSVSGELDREELLDVAASMECA